MKSMNKKAISPGAVHNAPLDLRKVLISDSVARAKWEDITPLARNEWICWVISVKKRETRRQHIERVRTELKEGMRRQAGFSRDAKEGVGIVQLVAELRSASKFFGNLHELQFHAIDYGIDQKVSNLFIGGDQL